MILDFAGGGVFFVWHLGAVARLIETGVLECVSQFRGVSTGALVAVLAACDADPDEAIETAYAIAIERGVYDRSAGLAGIWGPMIRRWLDALLPEDAARRCTGRVRIASTNVFPSLKTVYFDAFDSKADVIDAVMTSVHIPFFSRWRALEHVSRSAMQGRIRMVRGRRRRRRRRSHLHGSYSRSHAFVRSARFRGHAFPHRSHRSHASLWVRIYGTNFRVKSI